MVDVLIEPPRDISEEGLQAALDRARARPADDPTRQARIDAAEANLRIYRPGPLTSEDEAILADLQSLQTGS